MEFIRTMVNSTEANKRRIIIVDWFEIFYKRLNAGQKEEIINFLSSSENTNCYFVVLGNDYELLKELLPYFDTYGCLHTKKEISMDLFGTDIASPTFSKGQVFVKDRGAEPEVLYIPFFPDTWIEKFCRYYGVVNEEFNNG